MKIKVETEKKYYCIDPQRLISLVEKYNFKKSDEIIESDEYFTDLNSNFIKDRTCLRIRKTDNSKMEITFKGKSNQITGNYCKLENNINANINEYENFIKLFSSLGFYSYVEVLKKRCTYVYENNDYKYSVMIDKIPDIGGFVEFEIISDQKKSNKDKLKQELEKFISKFKELKLKEASLPYRDIVADYIYKNMLINKNQDNLYIDVDLELLNYEKDFFKKYKDEISKVCGVNIKWGNYKKNINVDSLVKKFVDEYLEGLIFDSNDIVATIKLLNQIYLNKIILTKANKTFASSFFKKFGMSSCDIIYLKEYSISTFINKNKVNKNSIVICNRNIKELNSNLLIYINNEKTKILKE